MKRPIFTGTGVAMVTPFIESGVDYPALRAMTRRLLDAGVDALIVCGTTGEASTMAPEERAGAIEAVVKETAGQIPVIAGTGSNCTASAIQRSHEAEKAGADALLVVTPYYNKASPKGLIQHYTAIADSVDRPVILYNVPSRTGVSCTVDTYRTLAQHPNIVGVKEASGSLELVQQTRAVCPQDFTIWSGNDSETAPIMAMGGAGVISVAANVLPQAMVKLTKACLENYFSDAAIQQIQLLPLCSALFSEVNPIPVKTALAMMGLCEERFRLPLCPMEPAHREALRKLLLELGCIR